MVWANADADARLAHIVSAQKNGKRAVDLGMRTSSAGVLLPFDDNADNLIMAHYWLTRIAK